MNLASPFVSMPRCRTRHFAASRWLRTLGLLSLLLVAVGLRAANIVLDSATLSSTNPCPGDVITLTVTFHSTAVNNNQTPSIYAVEQGTGFSCSSFNTGVASNEWWVIQKTTNPGSPDNPNQTFGSQTWPNNGGWDAPVQMTYTGATATYSFKIEIAPNATYSTPYNLLVGINYGNYQNPTNADIYACLPYTTCSNPKPSVSVIKSQDGVASQGKYLIYWLDYKFTDTSNNVITDPLPACATFVEASPQPIDGTPANAPAVGSSGTVSWKVPDATTAPYIVSGRLYVEVQVPGTPACASGALANQAGYSSSVGTGNSNSVSSPIGGMNVQLVKQALNSAGNPISVTLNPGDPVNYQLIYTLSGQQLTCFDSMDSYPSNVVHTVNAMGNVVGSWFDVGQGSGVKWDIKGNGNNGNYLYYDHNAPGSSNSVDYNELLNTCSPNLCGGATEVETDVSPMDPGSNSEDVGLVLASNAYSQNNPANPNQYVIILSVDGYSDSGETNNGTETAGLGAGSTSGAAVTEGQGHLFLEKNSSGAPFNTSNHGTIAVSVDNSSVVAGNWYTIKALMIPSGACAGTAGTCSVEIKVKFWPAGTAEPGWMIDYVDSAGFGCAASTGAWYNGLAGQADYTGYDNFRVYQDVSLTNAHLWDSVPTGITYQGSSPTAQSTNGGAMVDWDFTGNLNGANAGIIYDGSGTFYWNGVAACPAGVPVANIAHIGSQSLTYTVNSNEVDLNVNCGTPSNTPTLTSTSTPTPTRTATPTYSSTSTQTDTDTSTSTRTPSPTQTLTSTQTSTSTITSLNTATDTPTVTPTDTPSVTYSPSPTTTDSPTDTDTVTPSVTYSPSPTASDTPTDTPTDTPSITFSPSPTATDTPTPSDTDTPSVTFSPSPTFSDTNTATPTDTPSVSFTATPTQSDTPTDTPSATITSTRTVSPTITDSPVPSPNQIVVDIYNSAGELVRHVFSGGAEDMPTSVGVNNTLILSGTGGLVIELPGILMDPQHGQLSNLLWNTNNDQGQQVSSGVYMIKVETTDPFGQITSLTKEVQVINDLVTEKVVIYNSAGEVVASPALSSAASGVALAHLTLPKNTYVPVYDQATGKPSSTFGMTVSDNRGNSFPLTWDGTGAGGAPVSTGNYVAQLVYIGSNGNQVVESRSFLVVQKGGAATLAGAFAAPNPLTPGHALTIFFPVTAGLYTHVTLYNLAGEKAVEGADYSQRGWITLASDGLAPGIYIARLEKKGAYSVVAQQTLKVAIVH